MTLLFLLKIIHIAAASVWIGGGLSATPDIRRTLPLGPTHAGELMARLRATASLMNRSALVTVVSGIVVVFAVGGFARVPHRIHLGLLLTMLAIVVGRWLIRPVIVEIARASKGAPSGTEIDRIVARFRVAVGLEHALRLAVLILMVYPFSF
jgi:hypothetical protein